MNFQTFLYSASYKKDYRWLVVPDAFFKEQVPVLNSFFEVFDKFKKSKLLNNSTTSPTFFLTYRNAAYLFECTKTTHEDEYGRRIFALQGICVKERELFEFRNELPFILYSSSAFLNVWASFDVNEADKLSSSPSKIISYEKKLRWSDLAGIPEVEITPDAFSFRNLPIVLPFNDKGFMQLISYISSPYISLPSFAFGFTPEMANIYPRFKLISPIYSKEEEDNADYSLPF